MSELTEAVLRGGVARVSAQAANFVVRIGSIVVLARLLSPRDFGFVGMVTAITGLLSWLRDFGLSAATVQRASVTEEQLSSLFWLNLLLGAILGLGAISLAPIVARFYNEPRLFWVTVTLAPALLFNGAGVQHSAILQRRMRFATLSAIDVAALALSTAIGIGMAAAGFRYWSLVASIVCLPLITTVCLWIALPWRPSRPRTAAGIRSMIHFGGGFTLLQISTFMTSNVDKVLLGRFWGADALGLYGRAFQLVNVPTLLLNSAVAEVAFALLARVQHDRDRVKNYFLKSYSLVLAMTIPITICVGEFAPDLVSVLLGPKWQQVGPILRLLAPAILALALTDPIAWLIFSQGMLGRGFRVSMAFASVVIIGFVIGLPFGPKGVALGYSTALVLSIVPRIAWGLHGTGISLRDVARAVSGPMIAGALAGLVGLGLLLLPDPWRSPLPRLLLDSTTLLCTYVLVLLYVLRQKAFYFGLLRTLFKRENAAAAAQDALLPPSVNAQLPVDVSVVIPTYRREKKLREAIESVLAQTGVSFEVIVVDDSPEGSARASVESRGDSRVQYVRRAEPSGGRPALVRNDGAQRAVGRYLYFLDDDDILAPETLAAMAAELDAEPTAGMAFGVIAPFGDDEQALEHERRYFKDARRRALLCHDSARLSASLMFRPGLLANSACMLRRSTFERVGGYDAEIPICEDADLFARVAQASGHVFLDRIVVNYRTDAPSLMRSDSNTEASRRVAYRHMQNKYRRRNGRVRFIIMKLWALTVAR